MKKMVKGLLVSTAVLGIMGGTTLTTLPSNLLGIEEVQAANALKGTANISMPMTQAAKDLYAGRDNAKKFKTSDGSATVLAFYQANDDILTVDLDFKAPDGSPVTDTQFISESGTLTYRGVDAENNYYIVNVTITKPVEIPMTPLEPSTPVETPEVKPDVPMTPLEPSTPVETPEVKPDVPMTPLEPSTPVETPEVKPEIPMTPLEPSTPVETPEVKPEIPMTPLEPSTPVETPEVKPDVPMTPLEPSTPVETPEVKPDVPMTPLEPSTPVETPEVKPEIPMTPLEPSTPVETPEVKPDVPMTPLEPSTPVETPEVKPEIPMTPLEPSTPVETPETAKRTAVKGVYSVVSGDTLTEIAQDFGISVANLMEWNNLDSEQLTLGQRLLVVTPETATSETEMDKEETTNTEKVESAVETNKVTSEKNNKPTKLLQTDISALSTLGTVGVGASTMIAGIYSFISRKKKK